KAILLISDGEDLEKQGEEGAKRIAQVGAQVFVLGVGTQTGGPIPIRDSQGATRGFKRDSRGQSIISRFQGKDLQKLAQLMNGHYWEISTSESEVQEILKALGALDRTGEMEKKYVIYEERFYIPLMIAVFLLLYELSLS